MSGADLGGPLSPAELGERVEALAAGYDETGPVATRAKVRDLERAFAVAFAAGTASAADTRSHYARLLTLGACATGDSGQHDEAMVVGMFAANLATETGDALTAATAWTIHAAAVAAGGGDTAALDAAHRAASLASASAPGARALAQRATIMATTGAPGTAVLGAVLDAEHAHRVLPEREWGRVGYSDRTYHRAHLLAFGGWALARAELWDQAEPRIAEAAELSADTGLAVFVHLTQARVHVGLGEADAALDLATRAVDDAEGRPSAWVAGSVARLDRVTPGGMEDLVERTRAWGLPARAAAD